MLKFLFKFAFLMLLTLFSTLAHSQTVIDYQTWSTSSCNAFAFSVNVPATVNGVSGNVNHNSTVGQPTYDSTNGAITLTSRILGAAQNGTQYRISYNFKTAYSYKITMNVARIKSTESGANVQLEAGLTNSTGGSTGCSGTNVISASNSPFATSKQITSATFSNYIYDFSPLSGAQAYLTIGAIPPTGSVDQYVLIRKVTIEEIAPTPAFTISPSSLAVDCGTTTSRTFTVNNIHNSPGTLSYDWNLGSANNGWIYNGSPAPQTFTTSTNSISLTSSTSTTSLSNVSVGVVYNGSTYTTLTSNITTIAPTFSISGASQFCTTESYSIPNLPSGVTVAWSVSGAAAIVGSNTGPSVNISSSGGYSGDALITATLATSCGSVIVEKLVYVGVPRVNSITISRINGNYWCANSRGNFFDIGLMDGQNPANFSYDVELLDAATMTVSASFIASSSHATFVPYRDAYTPYILRARVRAHACGAGEWFAQPVEFTDCSAGGGMSRAFTVYPNPANTELKVEYRIKEEAYVNVEKSSLPIDFNIELLNKDGKVLKRGKTNSSQKNIVLQVADIPNGIYYLHIFEGKNVSKQQIVIFH